MAIISFKKIFQITVPALFLGFGILNPAPTLFSVTALADHSFWFCPFLKLTGFECPGCGLTRSMIAFFSRSLELSFYFHPFGPLLGFLIFGLWLFSFFKKDFSVNELLRKSPSLLVVSSFVVLLIWGVARNT